MPTIREQQLAAADGLLATGATLLGQAGPLPIDSIVVDDHPRRHFDPERLADLALAIRHKQLHPIKVYPHAFPGQWVLLTGARRLRAADAAGLATIDAIIVPRPVGSQAIEEQLLDDLFHEPLRPCERARAFQQLMRCRQWKEDRQLADYLKVAPGTISKALALLRLSAEQQHQIDAGELSPAQGYELAKKSRKRAQAGDRVQGLTARFTTRQAEVKVVFQAQADAHEIVAALEQALEQARRDIQPLRLVG